MEYLLRFQILTTLLLASGIYCSLSTRILAQSVDNPKSSPTPELRTTDELLNQTCNFLKEQQSFTVEIDINYDNLINSGEKVQYSAYQKVWVDKPNKLRSDYVGDERHTQFYYDGKSFTLFSPDLNLYGTKIAPSNFDEVVNVIDEKYGITIPLSNLFISDPCKAINNNIQQSLFIGTNLVNRVESYHILLTTTDKYFQLWISKAEKPVLLKAIITYKNLPGSPQYTALFSQWDFNSSITSDTFTFIPPEKASKIEFLPPQNIIDYSEQ